MAHELEINEDGSANMAYARSGGAPWHRLGVAVDDNTSPHEMCKAAGLDWRVEKIPLQGVRAAIGKTPEIILPAGGDQGLYRVKYNKETKEKEYKHLSTISSDWEPNQNEDAFRFFQEFTQAGQMQMETAGALKDGRIIWVMAKVNESFRLFKDDVVESYLLFSNPHIYGQGINIKFTPVRVVCNNTLAMALGGRSSNAISLNHRRKFDPAQAKKMLGIAHGKMNTYKESAEMLSKKKFVEKDLMDYFSSVFPHTGKKEEGAPEKMSRAATMSLDIMDTQPGSEFGRGTWWQAFNAVTYNVDHLMGNSDETRLFSAWYGNNHAKKLDAFHKALDYAQKLPDKSTVAVSKKAPAKKKPAAKKPVPVTA